ncbi:hypothetical protein OAK65_03685 [Synechococcus sp. AH-551-N17]|nr:hypothetical protein [Synechococcus sp. AH-551-N17]
MAASEVLEGQPEVTPLSDLPARTLGILNRGGPDAVTKAVKRLEQGERITEAKAREIVTPKCGESPQMADPWTSADRTPEAAPTLGAIPLADWDEVEAFKKFKALTDDGIAHMVNAACEQMIADGRIPEREDNTPAPTTQPVHEHLEELWRARLALGNWMGDEQAGPSARIRIGGMWFDATPSQMQGGPEAVDA